MHLFASNLLCASFSPQTNHIDKKNYEHRETNLIIIWDNFFTVISIEKITKKLLSPFPNIVGFSLKRKIIYKLNK